MSVLILVDVQKEYITEGRPFCLETIGGALENISKLLVHARKNKWKVFHVRMRQNAECFAHDTEYSEFIEGFEPADGEIAFWKPQFSCFSSSGFLAAIDRVRNQDIFLTGFGATMCCLSTLVDAHHRGYDINYVIDATCAKRTANFGEQELLAHVIDTVGPFANLLVTTEEVLNWVEDD